MRMSQSCRVKAGPSGERGWDSRRRTRDAPGAADRSRRKDVPRRCQGACISCTLDLIQTCGSALTITGEACRWVTRPASARHNDTLSCSDAQYSATVKPAHEGRPGPTGRIYAQCTAGFPWVRSTRHVTQSVPGSVSRGRHGLVRAASGQHSRQSAGQQAEILPEGVVLDVVELQADALVEGEIAAAVHLHGSGHAWLHRQTLAVPG
jgi:hypothetical protein